MDKYSFSVGVKEQEQSSCKCIVLSRLRIRVTISGSMNNEVFINAPVVFEVIIYLPIGILFTVIEYISRVICFIKTFLMPHPAFMFNMLLKKPEAWEESVGTSEGYPTYRHKKYPFFQIIVNFEKPIKERYHEEWLENGLFPRLKNKNGTSNGLVRVNFYANGIPLGSEFFNVLDDHRWFVPQPRIEMLEPEEGEWMKRREFCYDTKQIRLAKIIGKIHPTYAEFDGWDIYKFAEKHRIRISECNTNFWAQCKYFFGCLNLTTSKW